MTLRLFPTISVNQLKQNIKEVTVEDTLQFTNASYVKDSFRVTKGEDVLCRWWMAI